MVFNSSSIWYNNLSSTTGRSQATAAWPSESDVESDIKSTVSSQIGTSSSVLSTRSSFVPPIVTPSSSQLLGSWLSSTGSNSAEVTVAPSLSPTNSSISTESTIYSSLSSLTGSSDSSSATFLTESQNSTSDTPLFSHSSTLAPSHHRSISLLQWARSSSRSSSGSSISVTSSSSEILGTSNSSSHFASYVPSSSFSSSLISSVPLSITSTSEWTNDLTSTLALQPSTISSTVSPSASSTTSGPEYSLSKDAKSNYYIYTQIYHITDSDTTFDTGLPTTTARPKTASSSFSVPRTTETRGMQFYQNWLDGSLGDSNSSSNPTKNKIIGGVVGGVGGFLICCMLLWFMLYRQKNRSSNGKETTGFTSEIGRRAGYPLSSPSIDVDQEKSVLPNDGQGAFLSKVKRKTIAKLSRNTNDDGENSSDSNPFQDEFNFQARGPPAIPPPRKNATHPLTTNGETGVPLDNRFSYVSSLTDSSYISSSQGDYSSISSTSIRLGSQFPSNFHNHSEGSHGFLREVI